MRILLKQPLLHFLLIGGLLFALYYVVNPHANTKDTIVIDDEQVSRMVTVFQKEWNRAPSEAEMKGLMERYIQQEVYYRKALLMNLDHNDEIIRRRLDQKLRFITNDMATLKAPTDEELSTYYKTHGNKYLLPATYSFSHIYFSPDKRGNAMADAEAVLKELPAGDNALNELIKKGDPFPFSYHVDALTDKEIGSQMGDDFVTALQQLPINKWTGPIASGYGTHLVYINKVKAPSELGLTLVKQEVTRDYQYDLQQQYNTQMLEDFKKDFTIKLDIKDPKQNRELSQIIFAHAKP